jgi:photosystem II stability/assembly factor-like uncharacterized protein
MNKLEIRQKPIEGAFFVGALNAWIINIEGHLARTEDGGATWEAIALPEDEEFQGIYFCDSQRGWALDSQDRVLASTDSGRTWSPVTTRDSLGSTAEGSVTQVQFVDASHGWLVGSFLSFRTENGGATWEASQIAGSPGPEDELFAEARFIDSETGWLFTQGKTVYRTVDGARTWTGGKVRLAGEEIEDLFFINREKGWLCTGTRGGAIYATADGGKTWKRQQMPPNNFGFSSIFFLDQNAGWAAGVEVLDEKKTGKEFSPVVLKTVNGGQDWVRVSSGDEPLGFDRVFFADQQHGWLVGYSTVYRTTDGGATWAATALKLPDVNQRRK